MLRNNLLIAFRNLVGSKLQSLINLIGLTTGLASFILIFLWITDEFSFDKSYEHKNRIFQLTITHPTGSKDSNVPFILPVIMAEEYPEIDQYTRIVRLTNYQNCTFTFEDKGNYKSFNEEFVYLVDPGFFTVFSLPILSGDKHTPLHDLHSVVINKEIARKYFGDEDPIGKTITLNKTDNYTVSAVFEAPEKSHLNFNILIPAPESFKNNWNWSDPSYILLGENVSPGLFINKISNFFNERHPYDLKGNFELGILPITESYLGFGKMKYIFISSIVALFILFIAGINYVNLSLANFTKRAKEMMVRNVIGARRFQLVAQIVTESLIISIFSLILALTVVEILLPYFNLLFGRTLEIKYIGSFWLITGFILLAIFYGLMVGIYPAIFLSDNHLFNKFRSTSRIAKFRIYAVIFQFSISILLIICSIIVIKQLDFIRDKPLGIQTENIIKLSINKDLEQKYPAFRSALIQNTNIFNVSCGQALPFNEDYKTSTLSWPGKSPDVNPLFRYSITTSEYVDIFGLSLVKGRNFIQDNPADYNNFIINEEAVKQMGLENPIGEKIEFWNQEGTIIGVVKDFHHVSLHREIMPHIICISPANYQALRYIFIRLSNENIQKSIDYIRETTQKFSPDAAFDFNFINEEVDTLYITEKRLARIIILFAIMALIISSLGVLGMTAFLIEQRTKEISIRKINGASVMDIIYMLNKKILRWIIIATIISGPIAYLLSMVWLHNFAYRTNLSWWILLISGGMCALIALITSCYETIVAALKNPVDSLRYE